MKQLLAGFIAGVIVTLLVVGPVQGGARNCKPVRKCAPSTSAPSLVITAVPTVEPTSAPTSSAAYTFDDEFDTFNSAVWIQHYHCCGTLAGFDPSLARVTAGNLELSVENRSGGWYAYPVDTKTTWTQRYGLFEARIKVPKGPGLWPAFWGYYDSTSAELDTMEICANPLGTNGGNDASLLHTHVHWAGGGDAGHDTRTGDLSAAFHVYAVDWRADHVAFLLDGTEVWRFTDATNIPAVALPLIVNLGVGGSWCGAPTSATQSPSTMLVDWIRVHA